MNQLWKRATSSLLMEVLHPWATKTRRKNYGCWSFSCKIESGKTVKRHILVSTLKRDRVPLIWLYLKNKLHIYGWSLIIHCSPLHPPEAPPISCLLTFTLPQRFVTNVRQVFCLCRGGRRPSRPTTKINGTRTANEWGDGCSLLGDTEA